MENKSVLFGAKYTSKLFLDFLKEFFDDIFIVTINEKKAKKNDVVDYYDFRNEKDKNCKIIIIDNYDLKNQGDYNKIKNLSCKLGFSIGWQRIIPKNVLELFSIGIFGMHGSSENLPKGRGRSPLNWSIIENRKTFITNLFKYSLGVDDGEILDSNEFVISNKDTAKTLHFKNLVSMMNLVSKNISSLKKNELNLERQKNVPASYYPKRNPSDSIIDLREDINYIERFIRAVTKPFNGAFTFINNKKIIIFKSQIFDYDEFDFPSSKIGEVVQVFDNFNFLLKLRGGNLLILNYEYDGLIKKGMVLKSDINLIKVFQKNSKGNYDI